MLREFIQAQEGQKAVPYRPELTNAGGPYSYGGGYGDTNPYNPGSYSIPRLRTPISQREAHRHLQAYGGDDAIDHLMNAVNFTVQALSSSDWHFEDKQGVELARKKRPSDPADLKLAPADLSTLIEEPNPYMGWEEFIETTLIEWLLVGNAYWVKWAVAQDKPFALYRMPPSCVRIEPGQFGPEAYRYKLPGAKDEIVFQPDQVIHFKRPNPHSAYYGLGIVQGGARALDMEISLTDTMAAYYANQALPSGVVQTERRVPNDVFKKLKAQLRSFYSGSSNAGKLMILEAGLKYQTISPSAGDALFDEMGHWSRDRIYAMFHLNGGLMGLWDGTGDPKLADWQRLFDNKTAKPLLGKFGRAISRGLTQPGWGLDMIFDYEEVQQPDDVLKRAQTIAVLPGVKVHEVRDAAGLTPSTGDKKIDEEVLNMPGPELDATGQGGFPDPKMAGEPGRPPLAKNTRGFGVAKPGLTPGAGKKAEDVLGPPTVVIDRTGSRTPKPDRMGVEDALARLRAIEAKAMAPANVHVGEIEDLIGPDRENEVDRLVADLSSDLKAAGTDLERSLLDLVNLKSGSPYSRVSASKAWDTFSAKLRSLFEAAAQRAFSLANVQHSKAGFEPDFKTDFAKLAEELAVRPEAHGIRKTLKDRILKALKSADNPSEAIQSVITDWNAEGIALTEATVAYNEGTLQIAAANGSNEVRVFDGDEDEPCAKANGETWTIEHARKNRIQHPNCRRAFVPVPAVTS